MSVTFDRPVAGCAVSATANSAQGVFAAFVIGGANLIVVRTFAFNGVLTPRNVHVTLTCPRPPGE